MRPIKANIAGLLSPLQQAEMRSILSGSWPPLKPLPVFKYETAEYRAAIEFDKRRGEWVCRKTSLPFNTVQELRGGLGEITMALPPGEAESSTEGAQPQEQEQELQQDSKRRLQALHEWRKSYESGALYYELREHLSEKQRIGLDDSLRLSLTARQLQFSAKNVAYVFDALSTAGGRFAALIEFAKRARARQETAPQVHGEEAVPEAEPATDQQTPAPTSDSVPTSWPGDEHATGRCGDMEEFPAVSITNVLPEPDQTSRAERLAVDVDVAFQQSENESSEIVEPDASAVVEHVYREGHQSPAPTGFMAPVQTRWPSANGIEGAPSRFPALEISAFQVAVFGTLFLAVLAFAVVLTVGHGPLGNLFRGAPKSMLAADKPQAQSDQPELSASPAPTPPVAKSHGSEGTPSLDDAQSAEEKSKHSDAVPPAELQAGAEPEINSERSGAMGPIATKSPVPDWLPSNMSAAPHLPRSPAILVTPPSRGNQPFRVSFPEKAVAATSSLAMASQLSVLVSAQPGAAMAHKAARLEAGELVSFVWPHYPSPRDQHGLAETIRVRATIGQFGHVTEVKFLSGSLSLLPATTRAIRQWSYRPTLLDRRPVQAQQDDTIEFRPPLYSSKVSGQHPSRR